jgi:hypothetical protein
MARKSSSRTGKKSSVRPSSRTSGSRSSGSSSKSHAKSSSPHGAQARSSGKGKVLSMPRRENGGSTRERSSEPTRSTQSRPLSDHDEIRQWAEQRGAHPACVIGTGAGDDVGMIRLDFSGYGGEESLEEIDWDQWFQKFDDSGLVLLVQDQTAAGETSTFNKLVERHTLKKKSSRRGTGRGRGAA